MKLLKYKKCFLCEIEKDIAEFRKQSASKDGLMSYCKTCCDNKSKEYVSKNRERNNLLSKEQIRSNKKADKKCHKCKIYKKPIDFNIDRTKYDGLSSFCSSCVLTVNNKFREINSNYSSQYNREYYLKNKETIKANTKEYSIKNKSKMRKKALEYEKRPDVKIRRRLRVRIVEALKSFDTKKNLKTESFLGCDIGFFRNYIEGQFLEGMSWENHGLHGWHIDHIRPCASFDLTKESEQKLCFHYSNMQPLWAKENISKSSNYKGKKYYYDKD